MKTKMFGRTLNTSTMMYEFNDKSGVSLPVELCQQILIDASNPIGGTIVGLNRKWTFEHKNK